MCIATRCTSVEQFIQMFHRFVDEESFFVSTLNTRAPGLETSFSVQLVDGTPVLRGLCVVMQAWTDASNPFKTPGVRLGIKRLTANSMVVFEQLLITRSAAAKQPRASTGTGTPQPVPPIVTKPLGSAAPHPIMPVTTMPMAGSTKLKPPTTIAVGVPKVAVPKTLPKSPYAETSPTKLAGSRVELSTPARAASEPIPVAVSGESTDVIEEKTDVREPRQAIASLPEPRPMPPRVVPERAVTPTKVDEDLAIPIDDARALPLPPPSPSGPTGDVRQDVAAELELAKPPETSEDGRAPGSDLVLPANPLMNLTDESLGGYVDCTLYEETGNFFPADDEAGDFIDDVVPPPGIAAKPSATPIRQRTITPLPAAPDALSAETARDSSPAIVVPPSPPPIPRDNAIVDPALVARGSTPAVEAEHKVAVETPTFTAEGAPKPFDRDSLPLPSLDASSAPRHKRSRWWLFGGLAGMLVIAAAVVAITTMSSNGDSAPSPKPAKQVAQLAPPETKPNPAIDVTEAADEPDEPDTGSPPVVGEGPCKVTVASTPAGSIVALDGKSMGPSPLTIGASCEQHKLDIAHARYQGTSKTVTLTEGKPENVDVTLQRPTHTVTVTSTPSGATIFIDGRSAGTTPTKLSVLGFVTIKLEIKKTGYQPTTTKLYSRYPQDSVAVRLTKW
jgi:hypothetical protein